jgi:hypothetical protein
VSYHKSQIKKGKRKRIIKIKVANPLHVNIVEKSTSLCIVEPSLIWQHPSMVLNAYQQTLHISKYIRTESVTNGFYKNKKRKKKKKKKKKRKRKRSLLLVC